MRLSRSRELTINMGNYGERYRAGATVTLDHQDLGYSDEEWAEKTAREGPKKCFEELHVTALDLVNEQLELEIIEAHRVRDSDEPSFIEDYDHPEAPTRKRRRKN